MPLLAAILLAFLLAVPAQAQYVFEQPFTLDDPLARYIVCTATHQVESLGPYSAQVSIFSVPEKSGKGERLYVALVDDLADRYSRVRFWQGPIAARWHKLMGGPENPTSIKQSGPRRYRIERQTLLSNGRLLATPLEIDLDSQPGALRLVNTDKSVSKPTEATLLEMYVNPSLNILARLSEQSIQSSGRLSVRAYRYYRGESDLPKERPVMLNYWETRFNSHLLAVHWRGDQEQSLIHFLPMRHRGWWVEKVLASPAKDDPAGVFVLQMLAPYQMPNDAGELEILGARYRVSVGLGGVRIKTMKLGLHEWVGESWIDPSDQPPQGRQ